MRCNAVKRNDLM